MMAFVKRSDQLWKVWAMLAVIVIPGVPALLEFMGIWHPHSGMERDFDFLSGFISLAGIAWGCLAIRCPKCGLRVFWHLASTGDRHGFQRLAVLDECPRCGFKGFGGRE